MIATNAGRDWASERFTSTWLLLVAAISLGCSSSDSTVDSTPDAAAGTTGAAGSTNGQAGGATVSEGGMSGLGNVAGSNAGGTSAIGANSGGAGVGAMNPGGASGVGTSAGGTNAAGSSAGGVSSGGMNAGGAGSGGMSASGGNSGASDNAGASGAAGGGNTCSGGKTSCTNACVDLQTDDHNCGACGKTCAGGQTCSGGACTSSTSGCGVSPVDPNATPAAKNLLCYLYSQYKNHVLSGQQETSWSNPVDDITFYVTNTGKYPAILGGDFLYTGTTPSNQGTTTSRAQAYWAAGGLTMIRYHMGAPPNSDSYANSMLGFTSTQCNNVITSGTTENTSFKSKLDYVAGNLMTLQNAGVAVILALFHETQPNGWFWWSKCSNSQFLALYKYTYDYLVDTKGVHNVVRLMPFSGSPNSGVYPGKTEVDLVGPDTYATNPPFGGMYNTTAGFVGSTVPIPLHETGTIPQPSTMFPSAAPWLLWNVWAGYETMNNPLANIKSAYASPYTVTRDEIPSLK
jgi:hypothetical protein